MMKIEDLNLTQEEYEATDHLECDQVAIGFILAKRRHEKDKRQDRLSSLIGKGESLADRLFKNDPKGYPHG